METNPYLAGLGLVKQNYGTSSQTALAKCILSLYNSCNAFSIADILGPLDDRYTQAVLNMVTEFARHGETAELRIAGRYVVEKFPGLMELSDAMADARAEVHRKREQERDREAREEEQREEERRLQREANAKSLYCANCKQETKHLPIADEFECVECYERQQV